MTLNAQVEFLIWLLIAASFIAVLAARLRIPYTVALVLGGLGLSTLHFPLLQELVSQKPDWVTPNIGLILFLPPLLFEGSLKIRLRQLRENATPILLLATVGVLVATLITGYAVHWFEGIPILAALVFGAIISATDPVSVLAIFKEIPVARRLSVIVEGESLLNDGTAAVLYGILLAGAGHGEFHVLGAVREFFVVVLGGATVGILLGYVFSKITQRIDEPSVEITLTTVLAYSSYLAAESLHVSGVIATVAAGVTLGNFGVRVGMSARTRVALWSFWEYASFVINSLVFLTIGMQVRLSALISVWRVIALAIVAVALGRAFTVYGLTPISNLVTDKIPLRWQHVLGWGGMHGALSLALALSLDPSFPHRNQILAMTFGVVAFTIVFQGLTVKTLLRRLGIVRSGEDEYEHVRVERMSLSAAGAELDSMLRDNMISLPVYERLQRDIEAGVEASRRKMDEIFEKDKTRVESELRAARIRLLAARKSSIEGAVHDGLISQKTADKMIEEADQQLDQLTDEHQEESPPHAPPAESAAPAGDGSGEEQKN